MKESYWAYLLLVLGIFIIVVMMLIQNYTSTGEEDYYLTKEVMEAAMLDAVDYGVYADTGDIRIIESKFVENFIRRFADSVNNSKDYQIDFYEIYEYPPKATVRIKTKTGSYSVTTDTTADFDILTTLSGILSTKYNGSKSYEVKMKVYNGKANYETKVSNQDGTVEFFLTPNAGYNKLDIVQCGDFSKDNIIINGNQVSIINVNKDLTCTASYTGGGNYKVNMEIISGGSFVGNSSGDVKNGTIEFKVKPSDGKERKPNVRCTGNGEVFLDVETKNDGTIILSNITSDLNCYVQY